MSQQWLLAAVAIVALIPAAIARRKERSFVAWYVLGLALWPAAILAAVIADNPSRRRRCRFCAERIRREAVVCPHCRRDLTASA